MAKAITKGQLQGSMERVEDCIAETAGTAAAAVLLMIKRTSSRSMR
ncbi:MAG: hypothetical protein IKR38_07170 [Bacteroidales bacterium]|nr:hypothetical protein [Bacteroidales bacterium]